MKRVAGGAEWTKVAASEDHLGSAGRIAAGLVVLALLSSAILAVRGAIEQRRAHAQQAWSEARECARACAEGLCAADADARGRCSQTARRAAELCLELPEHSGPQLELRAALDELVSAIESGHAQQLASAIARTSHAGSALGWRTGHTLGVR
ncbi:MAG TPA: hypothetical protein VJV79_06020 [Polyangiaceae bacterium]|nr:hypothetical protein [Polyangiaceae bacterium]